MLCNNLVEYHQSSTIELDQILKAPNLKDNFEQDSLEDKETRIFFQENFKGRTKLEGPIKARSGLKSSATMEVFAVFLMMLVGVANSNGLDPTKTLEDSILVENKQKLLLAAAEKGDVDQVRLFIELGADVNAKDDLPQQQKCPLSRLIYVKLLF